jgi:hypothetical protein
MIFLRWAMLLFSVAIVFQHPLHSIADEPETDDGIPLVAPDDWRGETIKLPPDFAKAMQLKGVEKIRFAPGMFKPDADDFFSYVLVFRLELEPELTEKTLQRELLAYYRGLATAVGGEKIRTDDFSISLKGIEADDSPESKVKDFTATLEWIEPFATAKSQTLNFELRTWKSDKRDHNWLFMSVSPQKMDAPIWDSMHQIRDKFFKALADE